MYDNIVLYIYFRVLEWSTSIANGITSSPDVVAVSCIDIIYRLLLEKNIQIYYTGKSKSQIYKVQAQQEFERS